MTNCIKHKAVERIWLVPDCSEGQLGYVWCDDPAPGADMDPEDAVEYVRKDVHEARVAELEQERDALAAHVERLNMAWVDAKRCVSVVAFPNLYRVEQYQSLAKASIKKLESAFAEQPATNLIRLKLIAQAELMEQLAAGPAQAWDYIEMTDLANDLRQQAEAQQ